MKKIFISHSSEDKEIVGELIALIEGMGVKSEQIFCSSFEGYGIKLGANWLDAIREELTEETLVLFVLTTNFYNSHMCQCELGAVWANTLEHIPILVPPLTTKDLDAYNALLRYAFQVTEAELAETGWKDDEIKQSKFPVLQRADVLGCFDKNELIAQFAVYPLDMNIYGVRFNVGFVTSVCTYPEYTGHGIMKKLMIQCLTRMREGHKSFALLYPYSIPLYRNLGWEIISNKMTYTIKDRQIPEKLHEPGYVRRVSWDDEEFHKLHSKFAEKTHGCLYRNNLAWEEYWRWDEDDTMVAIYYSRDDVPYGYMVYMISSDIMHVKEMIYLNREAQLGLWEYIHAHDSMIDEVRGNNYYSEPIAFELDDSDIKETIRPYAMGRIIDIKQFFGKYASTLTNLPVFMLSTSKMSFFHGITEDLLSCSRMVTVVSQAALPTIL